MDKEIKYIEQDIPDIPKEVEARENAETKKIWRYLWKVTSWTPPYAWYGDYYYNGISIKFYTEDWRK